MSDATPAAPAPVTGPDLPVAPALAPIIPTKESVIERLKAKIEEAITELEGEVGHELTEMRADLGAIEHAPETFFEKVGAWFHKHL